jgi:hypothetical protein
MSDPKDDAQAGLAAVALSVGERYHHYKDPNGTEYEIITCAIDEETLAPLVVYRSLARGTTWVRTVKNWNEEVEFNGQRVKRFEKIS